MTKMTFLTYTELTRESIKLFHEQNGMVIVKLPPFHGKLLLVLLHNRDRIERDLVTRAPLHRLVVDYLASIILELYARILHRRLLPILGYVASVDVSHGWEQHADGNHIISFIPIKTR